MGFNGLPWKSLALATQDSPGKGAVVPGNSNTEPTGGRRKAEFFAYVFFLLLSPILTSIEGKITLSVTDAQDFGW